MGNTREGKKMIYRRKKTENVIRIKIEVQNTREKRKMIYRLKKTETIIRIKTNQEIEVMMNKRKSIKMTHHLKKTESIKEIEVKESRAERDQSREKRKHGAVGKKC